MIEDVELIILSDYEWGDDKNIKKSNVEISYASENFFIDYGDNSNNTKVSKTFYVEGTKDSTVEYILLYDNRFKRVGTGYIIDATDLDYYTKVSIVYNNYVQTPLELNQLGFITGLINISNCGSNSELIIKVFDYYDNRFISSQKVVSVSYIIHNLNVNSKYNIILEDLNKNIEQQISSFRIPRPY